MSYDYLIWRRSPTAKTAMLKACCDATAEGRSHEAMAEFDVDSFVQDLQAEFGDVNNDPEGPFLYGVDSGDAAPWISVNVSYSSIEDVTPVLVRLVLKHNLMLYDLQRECVWGNRRPSKQ